MLKRSNNFVRPTEIFDIARFEILRDFLHKEVRNVQGTKEFVRAIKKFEKLSIRILESQLYLFKEKTESAMAEKKL